MKTTLLPPPARAARGFVASALLICVVSAWLAAGTAQAGSLSGAYTVLASSSTINLTAEGLIDWAHWGYSTPTSFNHKVSATPQISNFTLIGTGPILQFGDNFTGYSWTNGTPVARSTRSTSGIYVNSEGNGFELSVPADTTVKTFKIYVGAYAAQMHFEAALSDGSAAPYTDESFNNPSDGPNRIYALNFASDSAGQKLTVKFWDMSAEGNVTLQAAVLREAAPLVELIKPLSGTIFWPAANGIQFKASTIAPFNLPTNQIRLILNDVEVSSELVLTGTALARAATYTNLQPNFFYRGQIIVADNLNRGTTNSFVFDTFSTTGSVVIEAEDYNHSGGVFIDNPAAGAYEGLNGVPDVDFFSASTGNSTYRSGDPVVTQVSTDLAREPFISAARPDYQVTELQAGDWMNYTRTLPSGNYNVYLRYASLDDQTVQLDRVTGDPTQPGQNLSALGTINATRTGNENSFRYAPMTDALGKPIVLTLGGKVTVRLTGLNVITGFNGLRANFLLFAPALGAVNRLPVIDSAIPAPDAEDVAPDAAVRIVIADGETAVVASSIRLRFDNGDVTAVSQIADTSTGATITYQPSALLPVGSPHTVTIEFGDNAAPAHLQTNTWSFLVASLPVIPRAWSTPVGSGRTSGFNLKIAKAPDASDGALFTNTAARAELQLAGQLIDPNTSLPFDNEAAGPGGQGIYIEPNVINYEQDGLEVGYFPGDMTFPGVFTAAPNYMAMAGTAYLELAAGIHRLGVRSDDGFRLTVGSYFTNANLVLGEFEGDRGSGLPNGSTEFEFLVEQAGVYAFRLLWYEGQGGADLEWFSADRSTLGTANVVRILINDPGVAGSVKAYQSRVGSPVSQPRQPSLTAALNGGNMTVSFATESGFTYLVQFKQALSDASWQDVLPAIAGDGGVKSVSQLTAGQSARFYRVRAQ